MESFEKQEPNAGINNIQIINSPKPHVNIWERIKQLFTNRKIKFTTITFFLILMLGNVGIRIYNNFQNGFPLFNRKIPVNFLLRPDFQAKPLLYIDGKWKSLPNSQTNLFLEDEQLLIVCGEGGAYFFDAIQNEVIYFFQQDWYPCRSIFKDVNNDLVEITDSKGVMQLDYSNRKIVTRDESYVPSIAEEINSNAKTKKEYDYKSVCDGEICANLSDGGNIILLDGSRTIEQYGLPDAVALVGLKDDYLFYATDASYGGDMKWIGFVREVKAFVLNHNLYVYQLSKNKSYKLLDNFRYDYQKMIFLDDVSNKRLRVEKPENQQVEYQIIGGVKDKINYPELDKYRRTVSTDTQSLKWGPYQARVEKVTPSDHMLGSSNAEISLIIYCNLEAYTCKDFYVKNVDTLLSNYNGLVNVIFRHSVVMDKPYSVERAAAEFAECVSQINGEDKFWEFIKLYLKQTDSSGRGIRISQIPNIVDAINGNTKEAVNCYKEGLTSEIIISQTKDAWVNASGCSCMVLAWKDGYQSKMCGLGGSDLPKLIRVMDEKISEH